MEPNFEELILKYETFVTMSQPYNTAPIFLKDSVIEAMKECWNLALNEAAKNATASENESIAYPYKNLPGMYLKSKTIEVDKKSILKLKI